MLVVMRSHATPEQIDEVLRAIQRMHLNPHPMPGPTRTAIGITGNTTAIDARSLEVLPGVEDLVRVTKPYKLASREMHEADTYVKLPQTTIGPGTFTLIAGPCSVENEEQIVHLARQLKAMGATGLRGGAYKPRTSPYSFQGHKELGLKMLAAARAETGLAIVTEVMAPEHVTVVAEFADVLQIGARNMQNYQLLQAVGDSGKPALLKRGMSATVEEFLLAAEYILDRGNPNVMLCERGIRTFEDHTRFTLPLATVPYLHEKSHLPVVVDPSHGTGKARLVVPMARSAIAAGADAIMIEVHDDPEHAVSDGAQTITPAAFKQLMDQCRRIAEAVDRTM
jgi:3-deoxy-7-phosphoheptulonate synthase